MLNDQKIEISYYFYKISASIFYRTETQIIVVTLHHSSFKYIKMANNKIHKIFVVYFGSTGLCHSYSHTCLNDKFVMTNKVDRINRYETVISKRQLPLGERK